MGDPVSLGLAGVGAAANALNMLSRFVEVRDEAKVLALKSELIRLLVEAQTSQLALIEEKRQLAERVRELEAWDREKQRYEPVEVATGVLAYALKAEAKGSEPEHKLCPTCFAQGRPSFLFPEIKVPGQNHYLVCHTCGSDFLISGLRDPRNASTVPRGGR